MSLPLTVPGETKVMGVTSKKYSKIVREIIQSLVARNVYLGHGPEAWDAVANVLAGRTISKTEVERLKLESHVSKSWLKAWTAAEDENDQLRAEIAEKNEQIRNTEAFVKDIQDSAVNNNLRNIEEISKLRDELHEEKKLVGKLLAEEVEKFVEPPVCLKPKDAVTFSANTSALGAPRKVHLPSFAYPSSTYLPTYRNYGLPNIQHDLKSVPSFVPKIQHGSYVPAKKDYSRIGAILLVLALLAMTAVTIRQAKIIQDQRDVIQTMYFYLKSFCSETTTN